MSGGDRKPVPYLKLRLPEHFNLGSSMKIVIYSNHLKLDWLEYLEKHAKFLFQIVADPQYLGKTAIWSNKAKHGGRKTFNLKDKVSHLIDSSVKIKGNYFATLKTKSGRPKRLCTIGIKYVEAEA